MMFSAKMLIGNKRVDSKERFEVYNPYTEEVIGAVPIATDEQIRQAQQEAYDADCRLSGSGRAAILRNVHQSLTERKQEFSRLITQESGLCLKHSSHEVDRALACFRFATLLAEEIDTKDFSSEYTKYSNPSNPGLQVLSEPLDLALAVTPFNHPLNGIAHNIAPAIASGTSMVLKPSDKTPLTALKLGEILVNCGMPPNLINIITGVPSKHIVERLIAFSKFDVLSFTGSVQVGKAIAKMLVDSGNELKRFIPELGGNARFIVMDDCDVDVAVDIAMHAFKHSGQRCTAVGKILLHNAVADQFLERFLEKTRRLKSGDPLDSETDVGTVISEEQAKLIEIRVYNAVWKGSARILIGNQIQGALYSPTIVDFVDQNSELALKETFGPVVSITRINGLEEAICLINRSPYKLAGAIATQNRDHAIKVSKAIKVGQFSWNGPPGYRTEVAPFGGFGDSGNGAKEGIICKIQTLRRIRTFYTHKKSKAL